MEVSKEFRFEASHILSRHPGKCSRLHGHSWRVRVTISGEVDRKTNFVLDYADLTNAVGPLVDGLDHRHLNCFIRYPSAENIALFLADQLRPVLAALVLVQKLDKHYAFVVEVSETAKTWARWDSRRKTDLMELDAAADDAEWRAPAVAIPVEGGVFDDEVLSAETDALHLFGKFQEALTRSEQLRLYEESLDEDPEIPTEVAG